MLGLKVDYRNYAIYKNLANMLGLEIQSRSKINNTFVVITEVKQGPYGFRVEYYDERDFRLNFKWGDEGARHDKFTEVIEVDSKVDDD